MFLPPIWHHIPFLFPPSPVIADLRNWAEANFMNLSHHVEIALFFVQWVPSGIKKSLYYKDNGKIYVIEAIHTITTETLQEMKNQSLMKHGILHDKEYEAITSIKPVQLAELHRERDSIRVVSDILFDPFELYNVHLQKTKDDEEELKEKL